MAAFSLRHTWTVFFAALYTLLEHLYMRLGTFEQHWWRYYMTFTAVIIFLSVARKWFEKIKERPYGLTRIITFYFVAMIIIHTPAPVLLLLGKQYYKIGFISNLAGNLYLTSIITIFLYHLFLSSILVLLTCVLKNRYWRIVPLFFPPIVNSIFLRMGILFLEDGWRLSYTVITYGIIFSADFRNLGQVRDD